MHKDLVNKYCIVTVMDKNGYVNEHMTVNLEINGKDYGTHLLHYGLAQRGGDYITDQEMQSTQIETILKENNPFEIMPLPEQGEMFSVLVAHVELPNVVYIQPSKVDITEEMNLNDPYTKKLIKRNKQLEKLEKLSSDLYHAAPTLPAIPVPKVGLPCCAQFGYDQCWYRAVIVSVYQETQQILVLFVDYGNSEVTTYNKLRAIPPSYLTLPCQSLRCVVSRLMPPANTVSWTKNALVEMMSAVANKLILAKVVKIDPVTVELYEGSEDEGFVYQSVIDGGYIQLDTSSGDTPDTSPTIKEVFTATNATEEKKVPDVVVKKSANVSNKSETVCEPAEQDNSVTKATSGVVDKVTEVAMATGNDKHVVNEASARISEITIDSTTDDDRSETSSVSAPSVSTTTAERVSKSSKSWAEMAEDGSSVDIDEILEFEDSEHDKQSSASEVDQVVKECTVKQDGKKTRKDRKKLSVEERKKLRESRKVEVVQHGDECFD
ncbi:tudor domain-containing protein 1-like [Ruditapes philippinarum]|uniref:tudor domain-containing protein 1-like n=1 Tax=Ruditapes philippinarum TaxID=129788 RepID=UPI00295A9CE1|nr:tudor domain-containing protein 1-like [Ruditapes philippinarum]